MLKYLLSPILLLTAICGSSANDTDAVNERISVRTDEMEQHWQVDCHATWTQTTTLSKQGDRCDAGPNLLRDLQLCVFIYQPPGGQAVARAPDYSGALGALRHNNCPTIP